VTSRARGGDILLVLSTNTYQAYNEWGGYSFYASAVVGAPAQMISFDRPTPPTFFEYEHFLVQWLERTAAALGRSVHYATNFDVHGDRGVADRYRVLISGAHNEYWSKEEFDTVHRRIFDRGRSTMFLGANTAYWQVRYADANAPDRGAGRGRQLVCYKSRAEEALDLITARFRDEARRPESMLMGSAYQNYFDAAAVPPIRYPYVVARTDLPFFQGVGYEVGEAIGDVVGYEWDCRDPEGDGQRLWNRSKSRIPAIDAESLKVLFTGAPVGIDGLPAPVTPPGR
jgi:hypothetical protein